MNSNENISDYIDDINYCISDFDIDESCYKCLTPSQLGIAGNDSNKVFFKDKTPPKDFLIAFADTANNCKVFFDSGVTGKGSRLSIKENGNLVYIGSGSSLTRVAITLLSRGDFVLVGKGVAVTSTNSWSTGYSPGKVNNGLIIGDHCLIASEIIIRPADGHKIIDINTREQVNISNHPIIIEPYCWLGQRSSILKNVRIGACSILSLGAVVTKSCPQFSALGGVPAQARSIQGKMWVRNESKESKRIQKMYETRFGHGIKSEQNKENEIPGSRNLGFNDFEKIHSNLKNIKLDHLFNHLEAINYCINKFDTDIQNYNRFTPASLSISGDDSNEVFIKGGKLPEALTIAFGKTAKNAKIFIGDNLGGKGSRISVSGDGNFVYIGGECRLNKVNLSVIEDGDSVIIGNEVTTTAANMWTTGHYSGTSNKLIIIGDDCMFSNDVTIRCTDGRPIFSIDDMEHLNIPDKPIVIGPHCWIGESSFIGKNSTIGACSIVAANAVVTKSCEKFTLMAGVPAIPKSLEGKIWGRNLTQAAKDKAKEWAELYK
ncbi:MULTISPECIES: acyltransferase [unclassified Pantoea]|uniref:acyltransferase n=1 Tax=unclassified Pantoea TaxID=2630326 RepID=UPI00301E2882